MSGFPVCPYDPLLIWSDGVQCGDTFRVLAIAALEGEADHYLSLPLPGPESEAGEGPLSPDYADYGITSRVSERVADIISEVMDQVAEDAGPTFDASLDDHKKKGLHDYALFLLEGAARLREWRPT